VSVQSIANSGLHSTSGGSNGENKPTTTEATMSEQHIRKISGEPIGTIRPYSDGGKLEYRDSAGKRHGTYDPKSNITRDTSGSAVGKGNWLGSFIGKK
jgi:hypothetical protein